MYCFVSSDAASLTRAYTYIVSDAFNDLFIISKSKNPTQGHCTVV